MKKTIMAIAAMAAGMTFAATERPTVQEVFKGIKNAEFDNVKIVYAPEKVFWNMVVELEGEKTPLAVESVKQKCRTEGGKLVYGPLACDGKTFDMKVVVNVRDTPSGKAYSGVVENKDKRVRVWNISNTPANVNIDGLGKPTGVFAPFPLAVCRNEGDLVCFPMFRDGRT